jgi:hypothetical protein
LVEGLGKDGEDDVQIRDTTAAFEPGDRTLECFDNKRDVVVKIRLACYFR